MLAAAMRVLVTGATGFIGFHATTRLLAEGHQVRALVRSAEKGQRVLSPLGLPSEDLVVGDMADQAAVDRSLTGCDAAIHAAASVSVTRGQTDFEDNVRGTENVIGGACARDLPVLYLSSTTAIHDPRRAVTETSPVRAGKTHYGRSKARAERWVRERQAEGAQIGIVYPSGVVGPDDPGFSESVKAYRSFLRGTLKSSGGNQFVDVRDLALLLTRMLEQRTGGRIIAAGHYRDWDGFNALLEEVTGARIPRIRAPGFVLRAAARGMDVAGQLSGRPMPMTGEGIEIATRWREIADSPKIAALGVHWRPAEETIADLFRWYLSAGRLPAEAVPALATATPGSPATNPARASGE
jgi:nucleoside-diphosphate-sugar epimerase